MDPTRGLPVRKPYLPLLGLGIAAAPVTVALADEPGTAHTRALTLAPAINEPLAAAALRRDAAARVRVARRRAERKLARERRRRARKAVAQVSPALQAIAACESGGNPRAVGGGGAYRGKYQFDYGTWASVGGQGDPAAAPEAEQDRRAAILYARSGATPWPVCGR